MVYGRLCAQLVVCAWLCGCGDIAAVAHLRCVADAFVGMVGACVRACVCACRVLGGVHESEK